MDLMTLMYKNNRKFSQSGQDAFVMSYFNNKRDGVFIDIGANDGITLSNTYYLEKELGWKGICIEPIPEIFEQLDKNRNCIKIMAGISNEKSVEKFTFVKGVSNMLSGMTKNYDPRHQKRIEEEVKSRHQEIIELDIQCLVLNDLLSEYEFFIIDYLSIDTEGNEFDIIKSIDFDKFKIKTLTVENNYNNKEQTSYILSKGFKFVGKIEADEFFAK